MRVGTLLSWVGSPEQEGYARYGAKGITLCEEWKEDKTKFFEWSLKNGYTDYLAIDRIDSYGNYEPSNCRWTDRATQGRNMPKQKKGISGIK